MNAEGGTPGILIFSDASADPKLQAGVGAYLALGETELELIDGATDGADILNSRLKIRRFATAAPTPLEIETVLWALHDVIAQSSAPAGAITLYTDSQSIINLPRRRDALERTGFISSSTRKPLKHAHLYQAFYRLYDRPGFNLVKVKGHARPSSKTRLDRVFSYVDKAARKALREYRNDT